MTYAYDTTNAEVYEAQTASDPMGSQVLTAAQDVYMAYYQVRGEEALAPLGVVVDQKTFRAHLVFTGQPILLPQESFIPSDELGFAPTDSGEYWE